MKKINLLVSLFIVSTCIFAQDVITSKKGAPILPEKGDWVISLNATPFLEYVGNFIGSNGLNVAPTFDFLSGNNSILGKYYINPTRAYRIGLNLGMGSKYTTTKVLPTQQTVPAPAIIPYVDDISKQSFTNLGLTAGMEWRKGKTKLQGFYGAEAGLTFKSAKNLTTYGNKISSINPFERRTEYVTGLTFGLGIRGFIGAEYFILPKISIGGEFGWGLALTTVGEGKITTERWNAGIVNSTTPIGGSTTIGFDSDNVNTVFGPAGTLRLSLHF